jgi:hypothetical protein
VKVFRRRRNPTRSRAFLVTFSALGKSDPP